VVPGRFAVKLDAVADRAATVQSISASGFEVVREFETLGWIVVTDRHREATSSLAQAEFALAGSPGVVTVEPIFTYELTGSVDLSTGELTSVAAESSNDPLIWLQWGHFSVNATDAWAITEGAGVVVAVVDSGVDFAHEDLVGNLLPGFDVIDNDADPTDTSGHGTHVAGTIAALRNNGLGGSGIAPSAQILPVRACDNVVCTSETIVAGIEWAANNGADVINLSLRGTVDDPFMEAATALAIANDVVVVAATGNDFSDGTLTYPAAYPGVIGVGALTPGGGVASFSNTGTHVDVVAPGQSIWSAAPPALFGGANYRQIHGTSMATPHIAAIAALLRADNPGFTQSQISDRILNTAIEIGPPGVDTSSGKGRVDAYRALTNGNNPDSDYFEIEIDHTFYGDIAVDVQLLGGPQRTLLAPTPPTIFNSDDDMFDSGTRCPTRA